MSQSYTHQQLAALQAKANQRLEHLNETKRRLAKEIVDAVCKAYDGGQDIEGVTFDLVFPAKAAAAEDDVAPKTSKNVKGKK